MDWKDRISAPPGLSSSQPGLAPASHSSQTILLESEASVSSGVSPFARLLESRRAPSLRQPVRFLGWLIQSLFGIVSLILFLAVVAAIPILNFLALGYLLEAEGRVARSGRLRDGFPLLDVAPRFGSIALGFWLWLLPLRLLADAVYEARWIDPASRATQRLERLLPILTAMVTVHLCLALARGGSLGCFFRPLKNIRWLRARLLERSYWSGAEQGIREFVAALRLRHHFSLGVRGFIGAFAWLAMPTLLFAAARKTAGLPILVTLCGGLLLVLVLGWVPFLQARLAAENRLGAMFEFREVRRLRKSAPLCWLLAVVVTCTLSLPLYLANVVLPPADAMWLVTLIFIVSIYPARLLVGWAYSRALRRRDHPAGFGWRWLASGVMLLLLGAYVFLLFFTQFIGEHGKLVLFQHHALQLPMPF